jgi:hypothetical protein
VDVEDHWAGRLDGLAHAFLGALRLPIPTTAPGRSVGAGLLCLPPYSPALNPIEQVFAKLKALLRTAAARTKGALWQAIGDALDAFTPTECANCLAHAGYVPPHTMAGATPAVKT